MQNAGRISYFPFFNVRIFVFCCCYFGMCSGAAAFNGDISKWDVAKVNEMTTMFSGVTASNSDLSISNLDVVECK